MTLFLTGDAGDEDEVIDAEKAKLVTFCRSANSDTDRENYENMGMRFIAKYNTDFWEIVSKEFDIRETAGSGWEKCRNTNEQWSRYYKGTISVSIRIEFRKLFKKQRG